MIHRPDTDFIALQPPPSPWPAAAGTTAHQRQAARQIAQQIVDRAAERSRRVDAAVARCAGMALAIVIGVACSWLLIVWAGGCDGMLCTAGAAIPTRRSLLQRVWRTVRLHARTRWERMRIAAAEADLEHYDREALYLPLQMKVTRDYIGTCRAAIIAAEAELRDLWGRP